MPNYTLVRIDDGMAAPAQTVTDGLIVAREFELATKKPAISGTGSNLKKTGPAPKTDKKKYIIIALAALAVIGVIWFYNK